MANEQNSSVIEKQTTAITISIECSDSMSARLDSDPREREESQRSLFLGSPTTGRPVGTRVDANLVPGSTSLFIGRSASVDDGVPSKDDELSDDPSGCLVGSPVSSQNSIDLLAKEYDEMRLTDSSDDEQTDGSDKSVHRHARKFARGYLEIKKDFEKLKAKHESHWTFAEAVQNEKTILTHELEQLKTHSTQEIGKLKERIRQLKAMSDMLQYGTQGKCGVCSEASKIIDSHPYSKVVLETVFKANYSGIFDLQQDQHLQPSSCKWKHLCGECDSATGLEEKSFKDHLESVLEGHIAATSDKICLSHADLFHVYTFRALLRNVDIHHYILEKNQECSCSELLHPLNNFQKRAHHLSKPFIWENRPEDQLIDPSQVGMLYHVCPSEASTPDHWIEFPLICKVHLDFGSHFIIFAQIPPFYWAFPLPLGGQDVPDTISDDMITSEILVKTHYKESMNDATQLSREFKRIIAGVNRELEMRRKSLDGRLQKWRDHLKKVKDEVLKKGDKLEAEERACKKEQEELHKQINEIEEERVKNKEHMTSIFKTIESLEKGEKTTCIANEKKQYNHKLEYFAAKRREVIRNKQDLSKMEIQYNEKLEKNASKQEELYARKLELIKNGLYADLEPKLMIGYFRAVSPCYLEVQL